LRQRSKAWLSSDFVLVEARRTLGGWNTRKVKCVRGELPLKLPIKREKSGGRKVRGRGFIVCALRCKEVAKTNFCKQKTKRVGGPSREIEAVGERRR